MNSYNYVYNLFNILDGPIYIIPEPLLSLLRSLMPEPLHIRKKTLPNFGMEFAYRDAGEAVKWANNDCIVRRRYAPYISCVINISLKFYRVVARTF